MVGNKIGNLRDFISQYDEYNADGLGKYGNCNEFAVRFYASYQQKYPSEHLQLLSLASPGDHLFIAIPNNSFNIFDKESLIVDTWANGVFKGGNCKELLCNPIRFRNPIHQFDWL